MPNLQAYCESLDGIVACFKLPLQHVLDIWLSWPLKCLKTWVCCDSPAKICPLVLCVSCKYPYDGGGLTSPTAFIRATHSRLVRVKSDTRLSRHV